MARVRVSGLPACLAPGSVLAEAPKVLERRLFESETGRLVIRELARTHVIHGYLAKSLRCRDCVVSDRCEGAHINFIRDQGFAELQPLREGLWAENVLTVEGRRAGSAVAFAGGATRSLTTE